MAIDYSYDVYCKICDKHIATHHCEAFMMDVLDICEECYEQKILNQDEQEEDTRVTQSSSVQCADRAKRE